MQTLILTVIGDDRAGLVSALADIVTTNGGNWERSQLAELAGKFAGIVVVTVPDERAADFRVALAPLSGLLDVTVHTAEGEVAQEPARGIRLDLVGNDSPGIVGAVSGVLTRHGVNVDELATTTTSAPMAGGHLFEAHLVASVPEATDLGALRADLERLASEIQVDLDVDAL
ncbi:MAG: ACT domain-containing protein [Dermatophilaceae bacterium]